MQKTNDDKAPSRFRRFRHWLFDKTLCGHHSPLGRLAVHLATRTPKRRWAYKALWQYGPVALMIFTGWAAHRGVTDLILSNEKHIPDWVGWPIAFALIAYLIAMWFTIVRWNRRHIDMMGRLMYERDITPLELKDLGEDIDGRGPGWRKVRMTFTTTIGKGRLQDHRIDWIEFSLNPETNESHCIGSSCPEMHAFIEVMEREGFRP